MTYRSVFRPGLFAGQTIIVTGGGSGIGRCTAIELASLGATVALVGRKREKLEAVQREIGDALVYPCDIRDEAGVKAMIADIVAKRGRIHGLVNNAGGQFAARLEDISLNGWEAVVRNNLTGGFLMSRECYLQSMQKEGGGAIVNIVADIWGGMPTMAHSGAARAGMVNLTETAATEWAKSNVRVNAVAPGWIGSSGMATYPEAIQKSLKALAGIIPLRRLGTVEEVSAAIVFLLSEAASFISGVTLRVDAAVPNMRHNYVIPNHPPAPAFRALETEDTPEFLKER
jgi:citronellol/citronellal dehydrogenase